MPLLLGIVSEAGKRLNNSWIVETLQQTYNALSTRWLNVSRDGAFDNAGNFYNILYGFATTDSRLISKTGYQARYTNVLRYTNNTGLQLLTMAPQQVTGNNLKLAGSVNPFFNGTSPLYEFSYSTISSFVNSTTPNIVMKIDTSTMAVVWQRSFNDSLGTYPLVISINKDASNNALVYCLLNISGRWGRALFSFSDAGALNWARYTDDGQSQTGSANFFGSSSIDSAGNSYITYGRRTTNGASTLAQFVMKYNSSGTVQWARYLLNTASTATAATYCGIGAADTSGNYYVAGNYGDIASTKCLTKFDTNGNQIWSKYYSRDITAGTGNIILNSDPQIAVDASGNVYMATMAFLSGIQNSVYCFIVKYDSSGNILWERQITYTGSALWANNGASFYYFALSINDTAQTFNITTNTATTSGNTANNQVDIRLPLDGSKLGSYVGTSTLTYTYSIPSAGTSGTTNITSVATTLTAQTPTISLATATQSFVTGTLPTSNIISIA